MRASKQGKVNSVGVHSLLVCPVETPSYAKKLNYQILKKNMPLNPSTIAGFICSTPLSHHFDLTLRSMPAVKYKIADLNQCLAMSFTHIVSLEASNFSL